MKNTHIKIIATMPWIALAMFWITISVYSCSADADEIQITIGSRHLNKNPSKWYNETNPGLIYSHNISDSWSAIGGVYKNTYKNTSIIAGAEYRINNGTFSYGGMIGLGTYRV